MGVMSRVAILSSLLLFATPIVLQAQIFDAGECVVIVQGFEDTGETFASNTTDAQIIAMKAAGVADVTAIRPNGHSGTQGGQTYRNKAELQRKLRDAICKTECKNVVLMLIGHGFQFVVTGQGTSVTKFGLKIGSGNNEGDGLFGSEIAAIIEECKKPVKLYSDHCFSGGLLDETRNSLPQASRNLIQIAMGSCAANQLALFWPAKDPGQYYVFSRYFLEDWYLLITNPNLIRQIKAEARRLNLPVMVVLLHQAYQSAFDKTKQQSDGARVPVEPVAPGVNPNNISVPETPVIKVKAGRMSTAGTRDGKPVNVITYKYYFRFYKVVDSQTGKCVVVGWVANALGLPIGPIRSVSCKADCSQTVFKFPEGTGETQVTLTRKANGRYEIKVGNTTEQEGGRGFRFESQRTIKFIKNGKVIGSIIITARPGEAPNVRVIFNTKPRRATVTEKSWDPNTGVLKIEVKQGSKTFELTLRFKAFGEVEIQCGTDKPFSSYLVFQHSLFGEDGRRVGEATFIGDAGAAQGELFLEAPNQAFALAGEYDDTSGQFFVVSDTSMGLFELSHQAIPGMEEPISKWRNLDTLEAGPLRAQHFEPPEVEDLDASVSCGNRTLPQVILRWNADLSTLPAEEEFLFSGFRVTRYQDPSSAPVMFNLPADAVRFADDAVEPLTTYRYVLSGRLDNLMQCECCAQAPPFPHLGQPLVAEVNTLCSFDLFNFRGLAEGGGIFAEINDCVVNIPTLPGESASSVADHFAHAVNADACLAGQGIAARAAGGMVTLTGPVIAVQNISINDPGLSDLAIPTLSQWGLVLLTLLLLMGGTAILKRRMRPLQ